MQSVETSVLTFRRVMKDHTYKMERKDNNCVVTDGEYESVELVSKSGDSLLISLVQNYPHLYVKTSKNQKDNALREKSWQEIAAILEQPASECLKRWTRLRERYSKEKRLSEQSLRGENCSTNRQLWPHFVEMGFLAQHIVGRRSYRNINAGVKRPRYDAAYSSEAPSPPDEPSLSSSSAHFAGEQSPCPSPSPSPSGEMMPSAELLSPAVSDSGRIYKQCSRRVKPEVDAVEEPMANVSSNYLCGEIERAETSEDLFCKYLASELNKMNEDEKKATKRRLMNALFHTDTNRF